MSNYAEIATFTHPEMEHRKRPFIVPFFIMSLFSTIKCCRTAFCPKGFSVNVIEIKPRCEQKGKDVSAIISFKQISLVWEGKGPALFI